ncbi:NADAR family protein [Lyngbya sp. CCY1209]|jgi:ribA/ribD-fused uncharacterized protein|uniref:NADAR family protein n=1 Tax=Lyngbya sp. CCY1209 TaxID=2886103 RepID=UPI002D20ECB1|nr:NADAR family protein [Lyngbya sp. CCY1209]MEB3882896.1 NADAR family protein [Lyngbya sp. CCY1209]
MTIYFYTSQGSHGCFSNFSFHGFELCDRWWPTVEHYFQAQKFAGTHHEDLIQRVKTPKDAARLGRDRKRPLRGDWNRVKDEIMRRGVLKKFATHADIREILLSTLDEELVENSPVDYYWGCGADGSGFNKMGRILMSVRSQLCDTV